MKKTYINPTIEVVDIYMNQNLLSGSIPNAVLDAADEFNGGDEVGGHEFNMDDEF